MEIIITTILMVFIAIIFLITDSNDKKIRELRLLIKQNEWVEHKHHLYDSMHKAERDSNSKRIDLLEKYLGVVMTSPKEIKYKKIK